VSLPKLIVEIPIILLFTLHITKNIADKRMVMDNLKIQVYLISRFYAKRKNLMLAKYTRFTVCHFMIVFISA